MKRSVKDRQMHGFKQSKINPKRRITWQSARLQGWLLACTAKRQYKVTAQIKTQDRASPNPAGSSHHLIMVALLNSNSPSHYTFSTQTMTNSDTCSKLAWSLSAFLGQPTTIINLATFLPQQGKQAIITLLHKNWSPKLVSDSYK